MALRRHARLVLLTAALLLGHARTGGAQLNEIDIGGMVAVISDSWTAQVFHIVDQLSEWDVHAHSAYGRWARRTFTLDARDRELLRKHAEIRRARGWGHGFEEAFYVDDSIPIAAQRAVDRKLITAKEAAVEVDILMHFAPRLAGLRTQSTPRIELLTIRLKAEAARIAPVMQQLATFAEAKTAPRIPVFLVPNPEAGTMGGRFSSGRLIVEVAERPDALPTFFHEAVHVLLDAHRSRIGAAADSAGLTFEALNEGIAYAFSPGLTTRDTDILGDATVRLLLRGTPVTDNYLKSYSVALVLRPLLRASLDRGETIKTFLPQAIRKWKSVARLPP